MLISRSNRDSRTSNRRPFRLASLRLPRNSLRVARPVPEVRTQAETRADRATRAMFKIVRRLDPAENCNDLPVKPKGMHWGGVDWSRTRRRAPFADHLSWIGFHGAPLFRAGRLGLIQGEYERRVPVKR